MKNDVDQIKKATEVVYYEPWLKIDTANASGVISKQNYFTYDFSASGIIDSVLKGPSLLNAQFIQFGTGDYYKSVSGIPSGSISGVQNLSYYIPSGVISSGIPGPIPSGVVISGVPSGVAGWNFFESPTSTSLDFYFIIQEKNKFTSFTELAILNSNSGCIYYASFPKVQWHTSMYNNIRVQINLV